MLLSAADTRNNYQIHDKRDGMKNNNNNIDSWIAEQLNKYPIKKSNQSEKIVYFLKANIKSLCIIALKFQ